MERPAVRGIRVYSIGMTVVMGVALLAAPAPGWATVERSSPRPAGRQPRQLSEQPEMRADRFLVKLTATAVTHLRAAPSVERTGLSDIDQANRRAMATAFVAVAHATRRSPVQGPLAHWYRVTFGTPAGLGATTNAGDRQTY